MTGNSRIVGIIPARMASTRFPGKPLAPILGLPMIEHVRRRVALCDLLNEVIVATCDIEIKKVVEEAGGKVVMTANTHERATDRTTEAMLKIERQTGQKADIVVMIQGDEPMVHPDMIDEAIAPMMKDSNISVLNLMSPLKNREEHGDPNEVKVVVDRAGFALYFSREAIPSWKMGAQHVPMLKQVCIIPFRREFLLKFTSLEPTPLERIESIDMLRVLEHGYKVKMMLTTYETYSVDTPHDLMLVEHKMASDLLVAQYR